MKRNLYIFAVMVLGVMLSFIAHAIIEMYYIKFLLNNNIVAVNTGVLGDAYCLLPASLQIGLLLLGVIGGYILGQTWWRMVYIEKRHWHFK